MLMVFLKLLKKLEICLRHETDPHLVYRYRKDEDPVQKPEQLTRNLSGKIRSYV